MTRLVLVIVAVGLLAGCEHLNDTMVRKMHEDRALGYKVNEQINDGYRRRMELPPPPASTHQPVPPGLDQG